MKALSVRQPWAWLILHGGKDIENRTWYTSQRGRVLIHAAKGMTREEYARSCAIAYELDWGAGLPTFEIPHFEELKRGGIIGSVEIVDCVAVSESPWFAGPYGFVLRDPKPLPFVPLRGALSFFNVDDALIGGKQ